MTSQEIRDAVRPSGLLMMAVWVGSFLTYGVYYFIAYRAVSQSGSEATAPQRIVTIMFSAMAVWSLVASLGIRWFVFSQWRSQRFLLKQIGSDESEEQVGNALIKLARVSFQPYLMCLGAVNSCIMFGMILSIISRDISMFTPFIAAGLAAGLLCFPKLGAFIETSADTWKNSFRRGA